MEVSGKGLEGKSLDSTPFRQPNYSVPANNRPLTKEELAATKEDATKLRDFAWANNIGWGIYIDPDNYKPYAEFTPDEREARMQKVLEAGGLFTYLTFADQLENMDAAQFVGDTIRARIRSVVKDPVTAELLCPNHVIGCKRTCADSGYYEVGRLQGGCQAPERRKLIHPPPSQLSGLQPSYCQAR